MIGHYKTAYDFRTALEARLRNLSHSQGIDLQRLQRSVAFERFLARLFFDDDPFWLLKGGFALELRFARKARSTLDLDISVLNPSRLQTLATSSPTVVVIETVLFQQIQRSSSIDLKDGFEFFLRPPRQISADAPDKAIRITVEARLAGRSFSHFHLDIGLNDAVFVEPEWIWSDSLLNFAGITPYRIAMLPVTVQFAEKIHAYTFPWKDRTNTRVKDLIDLILLLDSGLMDRDNIRHSLLATFSRPESHPLPQKLPPPPYIWAETFSVLAAEVNLSITTLSEAYTYVASYWEKWQMGERCVNE